MSTWFLAALLQAKFFPSLVHLRLEPSVFRAHRQVLRIFYSPPPPHTPLNSLGPSIVNPPQPSDISPGNHSDSRTEAKTSQTTIRPQRPAAKSDSETLDSHMAVDVMRQFSSDLDLSDARPLCTDDLHLTSTAPSDTHPSENIHPTSIRRSSLKRRPPRGPLRLSRPGTTRQHFLAFVQPNVRLFNTLLIPVPPGDESFQALNVVAAMILVSVRSVGEFHPFRNHMLSTERRQLQYSKGVECSGFLCVFANDWGRTVLSFELELVYVSARAVEAANAVLVKRRVTLKPRPTIQNSTPARPAQKSVDKDSAPPSVDSTARNRLKLSIGTPLTNVADCTPRSSCARQLGIKMKRLHGDSFMYTSLCRTILDIADVRIKQ
ncbi:unnamed protein product [Dicrocoelium dendriticum]|nr:unnamed protein product [Dicrocoelium dendriticum]